MMVLGNIVAVTSIIAVVSLMQGMNGYVADAILKDVGAGTFKVEQDRRHRPTRRKSERRGAATRTSRCSTRKAIETFDPTIIDAVMAESGAAAPTSRGATERSRARSVRGVSADYEEFSGYDRRDGAGCRAAIEVERGRNVALLGWDTADKLFKGRNPLDKVIQVNGHALPRARRQREEGLGLRQLAGRVRADPARRVPAPVRLAASLEITVKPVTPSWCEPAMDARAWRCA